MLVDVLIHSGFIEGARGQSPPPSQRFGLLKTFLTSLQSSLSEEKLKSASSVEDLKACFSSPQKILYFEKMLGEYQNAFEPLKAALLEDAKTLKKLQEDLKTTRSLEAFFNEKIEGTGNEALNSQALKAYLGEARTHINGIKPRSSSLSSEEHEYRIQRLETVACLKDEFKRRLDEALEESVNRYFASPVYFPNFINKAFLKASLGLSRAALALVRYFYKPEDYAAERVSELLDHPDNINFGLKYLSKIFKGLRNVNLPKAGALQAAESIQRASEDLSEDERARISFFNEAASKSFGKSIERFTDYVLPAGIVSWMKFFGVDASSMAKNYLNEQLNKMDGVSDLKPGEEAYTKKDLADSIFSGLRISLDGVCKQQIIKYRVLSLFEALKKPDSESEYQTLSNSLGHLIGKYFSNRQQGGEEFEATFERLDGISDPKDLFEKLVKEAYEDFSVLEEDELSLEDRVPSPVEALDPRAGEAPGLSPADFSLRSIPES